MNMKQRTKKHGMKYNVVLWDDRDVTSQYPDSDFGWFTFLDDALEAIEAEVIKVPTISRYEITNSVGASVKVWTR